MISDIDLEKFIDELETNNYSEWVEVFEAPLSDTEIDDLFEEFNDEWDEGVNDKDW